MTDLQKSQARELLTKYATTRMGHQAFMVNGKHHEGYILEVRDNDILFSWAFSPFDESDEPSSIVYEIPFESIDLSSLKW